MSNALFCRARILFCVGVGTVLIGLTASACEPSPESVSVPTSRTSVPVSSTASSPPNTPSSPSAPASTSARPTTSRQPSRSPVPTPPGPVPVLGTTWGPDQKGYGAARPDTIFNGGDPTGLVTDVRWKSWGGPVAIASGMSYDPHGGTVAGSTREKATVEAFNLGVCHGTLMYQAIEWYFPADGDKFDPHIYINICTGEYVGS